LSKCSKFDQDEVKDLLVGMGGQTYILRHEGSDIHVELDFSGHFNWNKNANNFWADKTAVTVPSIKMLTGH
jgi:hypothetical protein